LRFGICNIAPSGSDILFSEERVEIGRNFCNKLWNAARFRQMSGPMEDNSSFEAIISRIHPGLLDDTDHWILGRLHAVTGELEKCFANYEIAPLTHLIYAFFWSDFCDWYVEASKGRMKEDEDTRDHCLAIQDLVIRQVLQLAHPIVPHITEELWRGLGYAEAVPYIQNTLLIGAETLEDRLSIDAGAMERIAQLQELISQARALKAQYNLAAKRDVSLAFKAEGRAAATIDANQELIRNLAGLGDFSPLGERPTDGWPAVVTPLGSLYLDLSRSIDVTAEKTRLGKELEKLNKLVAIGEKKLANPKFTGSAPEHVVEGARKQLAETTEKRDETQRILESL
jgi:valyl-tRNA synthetase